MLTGEVGMKRNILEKTLFNDAINEIDGVGDDRPTSIRRRLYEVGV